MNFVTLCYNHHNFTFQTITLQLYIQKDPSVLEETGKVKAEGRMNKKWKCDRPVLRPHVIELLM